MISRVLKWEVHFLHRCWRELAKKFWQLINHLSFLYRHGKCMAYSIKLTQITVFFIQKVGEACPLYTKHHTLNSTEQKQHDIKIKHNNGEGIRIQCR